MYFISCLVRSVIGLFAAFQFFGVVRSIGEWQDEGALVVFATRVHVLAVFAGLFVGLHSLINALYQKRHGMVHPALENPWAL